MENIRIRTACEADVPPMLSIYAHYVRKTAISFEYVVPSKEEFTERLRRTLVYYPWLAAEKNGRILGYAYASAFHPRKAYQWCAETSIYIAQDERGHGLGAQLYDALEYILKRQNMLVLYACIASPPREDEHLTCASQRFHTRMGFHKVGEFPRCGYKFNKWYNMVWMEKRISQPTAAPLPVIPFPEVKKD